MKEFKIESVYQFIISFEDLYQDVFNILEEISKKHKGVVYSRKVIFEPLSKDMIISYNNWWNFMRTKINVLVDSDLTNEYKREKLFEILNLIKTSCLMHKTDTISLRTKLLKEIESGFENPEYNQHVLLYRFTKSIWDRISEFLEEFK